MFHFAGCQSPVLLLLRWASQLLVEGVGQEGEHCEGREALADYLIGGEEVMELSDQEKTHRQTGPHLRQFVLKRMLSILVQSSFYKLSLGLRLRS